MRRAALVALVAVAAGCGGQGSSQAPPEEVADASDGMATTSPSHLPDVAASPAHPLPPSAPALFAFGSRATPDRVARWDIDVRPDGEGLPPGAGDVDRGARVWAETCATCHGPTGTEGPYQSLVGGAWPEGGFPEGRTVGSYWPWATTLFDYIRRAMPQDRPGTLDADDTYAVIAWILSRNGIVDDDAVMDATTLPRVVMPARDRFVRDDRTGGTDIR